MLKYLHLIIKILDLAIQAAKIIEKLLPGGWPV